jgi:hypothetical protein
MEEARLDFIEELLRESEAADATMRVEMDRLRADQMLSAVSVLEDQMQDANDLVDKELRLLEEYRSLELARLDKKRSWLLFNLEAFARSTGEKTARFPHGTLKLRKGRDRVAVVAIEKFLEVGPKLGLVRTVPETITPDIQAVLQHIKRTGEIPPGVEYIPAETRFSYSVNGGNDESEREQTES